MAAVDFLQILELNFFGNTLGQYLFAAVLFTVLVMISFFLKKSAIASLKKVAKKTKTEYDDIIIAILGSFHYLFYFIISAYVSLLFLNVPKIVSDIAYYILFLGALYYLVKALQSIIDFFAKRYWKVIEKNGETQKQSSAIEYLSKFSKMVLWVFAALLFFSNLGIDITPLIAGLGIGGIAIALALQNILGDIFNFFAIFFDKPFVEGDFLIIGDDLGTVEKIGIRSTRIKTLRGEELIMSNRELTSTRIHNFKKMDYRRIQFGFGVLYETPERKLEKIPKIVKDVILKSGKTRFDRAHFKEFGNYSLNYEVVYYLDSSDYNEYMDVQQKINLGIKKALEKEKIEFAYPTYKIIT